MYGCWCQSTLVDINDAVALKNISRSAPDVPPIEAEIESASLSHSAALSASYASYDRESDRIGWDGTDRDE